MNHQQLRRETITTSRAADFLERSALVSQTGRDEAEWDDVVVKELLDNALDACETAGVEPGIEVELLVTDDVQWITVSDNAPGIPAEVVARILDFATTTSDKRLYRSPARGAQGNALKTIIGIAHVLGTGEPVVIEAQGIRHTIGARLDLAGDAEVSHDQSPCGRTTGTSIVVPLSADLDIDVYRWVADYGLVNPHASFTVVELIGSYFAMAGTALKAAS